MPDDILREELARLLGGGDGPGANDALDVLWIARLSGLAPMDMPLAASGPQGEAGPPPAPVAPEPPRPDRRHGQDPADPAARLHLPGATGLPARAGGAQTVRVAQPAALPAVLDLNRALRPLRRTIPSARARVLDERATAAATGDTGLLLPVLRPALERRFSVDLLIDSGTTMAVWHRLGVELRTLLERHGAFAAVRAWALHTDGPEPRLAPFRRGSQSRGTTRRWRQQLSDATGRRIVLVLTDGVGPAWYGSELPATLADWSVKRPVAALQVLPMRLWHRTALRTAPVRARGTDGPRATLEFRSTSRLPGIARGRAGAEDRDRIRWLPVLEVAGPWFAPWAGLVSGNTTDWTPLLATPLTVADRPRSPGPSDEPGTPAGWIERFEAGYSEEAFHLLRLLAAAPLSLPVMRLVQSTLFTGSTPMHLAEIFLSGLLVRRTPAQPGEDPDTVQYDFREGVREALLARLTRTESLRVLRQVMDGVGERVSGTFGGITDFAALAATGPDGLDGLELSEDSRSFAEVALAVIRGVGGDYADVVARLERGAGRGGPPRPEAGSGRRGTGWWWLGLNNFVLKPVWSAGRRSGFVLEPVTTGEGGRADRPGMPAGPGDGTGSAPSPENGPVPHLIPELPEGYVRRDETEEVLAALRAGDSICLIEGADGVGKTALAIACARELAEEFTLVRWIRAGAVVEDLRRLAHELGLPDLLGRASLAAVLSFLRNRLRRYSRWLLVLDGVTSSPDSLIRMLRHSAGGGSVLATHDRVRLPGTVDTRVTLEDFSPHTALAHVRSILSADRGELWERQTDLADLVEVLGTHPGTLAESLSQIRSRRTPVGDFVREALMRRPEVAEFLRSLVPVLHQGECAGTGVVVRPETVLVPEAKLSGGPVEIPFLDGRYAYRAVMAQWSPARRLSLLNVPAGIHLHPLEHAGSTGSPVTAAWYAPGGPDGPAPTLHLRPAATRRHTLPPGAALIDANGTLCAVTTTAADGRLGVSPLGPDLLDTLLRTPRLRDTRAQDLSPEPPAQEEPYFYLSYARTPSGGSDDVLEFCRQLSDEVSRLAGLPGHSPVGFIDRTIPVGAEWESHLRSALATARVLVPLYTPRYFTSEWCGKEWQAFQRRQADSGRRQGSTGSAVVPVLWVGAGGLRLPRSAAAIQYVDDGFGDEYVRDGLLGLRRSGRTAAYGHMVRAIAHSVVRVARATALRPCDPALLDNLTNAFAEDDDLPSAGS